MNRNILGAAVAGAFDDGTCGTHDVEPPMRLRRRPPAPARSWAWSPTKAGALIPGATITLTDPATKTKRTTLTNKDGQYVMVSVDPGNYNISATRSGFSTTQIANEVVSVGTQTTANFSLAVGAESTTVEVQATTADLQTMNSTIGSTVTPTEISSLPAIGRDVSTFATLQPGVTPGGSVAGTVSDQAVFQLDGGNNSSDMDGSTLSYTGTFGNNPTGVTALGARRRRRDADARRQRGRVQGEHHRAVRGLQQLVRFADRSSDQARHRPLARHRL